MKKSMIIIIILLVFIFVGCNNSVQVKKNSDGLIQDKLTINNDDYSLSLSYSLTNKEEDYINGLNHQGYKVGAIFLFGNVNNILDINLLNTDAFVIREEENLIKLNVDLSNHYEDNINVRLFYTITINDENFIVYSSKYQTYDFYQLACLSPGSFSDIIISSNKNRLNVINIFLNTKTYEVSTESNKYDVKIKTPLDYNVIEVIITLKENVRLNNDFLFIVNDEMISIEKIDINNNVITYIIPDPNWSGVY